MNSFFKKTFSGLTVAIAMTLLNVTAFAGQVGTVTASLLNVRDSANTAATVITQLSKDTQVSVLESADGWYKISTGDSEGWVSADYLSVSDGTSTGTITGSNVNVRTGPSTGYDIIVSVSSGENVNILTNDNGWYKVEFSSGVVGWVKGDYISTGNGPLTSRSSSTGNQIANLAMQYVGIPYSYGGSSASGVDCSGFVKLVYNNFGIYVDRVASSQATQGTYVSTSNLSAGDLVFFKTEGASYINHVGIYVGNGQFVHASSGAGKVTVSSIWDSYYSPRFVTARTLTR